MKKGKHAYRQRQHRSRAQPQRVVGSNSDDLNTEIASLVRQGELRAAEQILEHMILVGLQATNISFNLVINVHKVRGDLDTAELWLNKMFHAGVKPNSVTYTTLISGCEQLGDVERAERLFASMLQEGCEPNEQTHNAMMSAYVRSGDIQSAERWLQGLLSFPSHVRPNAMSFNTLIHAYTRRHEFDKAGYWFAQLMNAGLMPTQSTICALVDFFVDKGDEGMMVNLRGITDSWLEVSDLSYNTIIKACARRGDAEQAEKVLKHMLEEGHVCSLSTYNAMIHACTQTGDIARAERYFRLMGENNVAPDSITFNTVINSCATAGDAVRAQHWLLEMIDAEVLPNEVTYGTICKAYARQGKPDAVKFMIDALEESSFPLNEYFYASWISAFGAARPPDMEGAEAAFALMVEKGLKIQNVKRALIRAVGETRAAHLTEVFKKKKVAAPPGPTNVDHMASSKTAPPLGLACHQQISRRIRQYSGSMHMQQGNARSSSRPGLVLVPPATSIDSVPALEVPMPLFLRKGQLPSKQQEADQAGPLERSGSDPTQQNNSNELSYRGGF